MHRVQIFILISCIMCNHFSLGLNQTGNSTTTARNKNHYNFLPLNSSLIEALQDFIAFAKESNSYTKTFIIKSTPKPQISDDDSNIGKVLNQILNVTMILAAFISFYVICFKSELKTIVFRQPIGPSKPKKKCRYDELGLINRSSLLIRERREKKIQGLKTAISNLEKKLRKSEGTEIVFKYRNIALQTEEDRKKAELTEKLLKYRLIHR